MLRCLGFFNPSHAGYAHRKASKEKSACVEDDCVIIGNDLWSLYLFGMFKAEKNQHQSQFSEDTASRETLS